MAVLGLCRGNVLKKRPEHGMESNTHLSSNSPHNNGSTQHTWNTTSVVFPTLLILIRHRSILLPSIGYNTVLVVEIQQPTDFLWTSIAPKSKASSGVSNVVFAFFSSLKTSRVFFTMGHFLLPFEVSECFVFDICWMVLGVVFL